MFTLSFTLEDAEHLYMTAASASIFREEDHAGRFDFAGKNGQQAVADMSLALPDYDNGSLLWCTSAGDALLLRKIHEAAGYTTELFGDAAADDPTEYYVVLTSWDYTHDEPALTADPVAAEFYCYGPGSKSASELTALVEKLVEDAPASKLLGQTHWEDHGDHFHGRFMAQLPGEDLKEFLAAIAEATAGPVGYDIISDQVDV